MAVFAPLDAYYQSLESAGEASSLLRFGVSLAMAGLALMVIGIFMESAKESA